MGAAGPSRMGLSPTVTSAAWRSTSAWRSEPRLLLLDEPSNGLTQGGGEPGDRHDQPAHRPGRDRPGGRARHGAGLPGGRPDNGAVRRGDHRVR